MSKTATQDPISLEERMRNDDRRDYLLPVSAYEDGVDQEDPRTAALMNAIASAAEPANDYREVHVELRRLGDLVSRMFEGSRPQSHDQPITGAKSRRQRERELADGVEALTLGQVDALLRRRRGTAARLIRAGRLAAVSMDGEQRIARGELDRFLAAGGRGSAAPQARRRARPASVAGAQHAAAIRGLRFARVSHGRDHGAPMGAAK